MAKSDKDWSAEIPALIAEIAALNAVVIAMVRGLPVDAAQRVRAFLGESAELQRVLLIETGFSNASLLRFDTMIGFADEKLADTLQPPRST